MTFAVVHLRPVGPLKTPAPPCTGGRRDRAGECGTDPHHGTNETGGHTNMCPPFVTTKQAKDTA